MNRLNTLKNELQAEYNRIKSKRVFARVEGLAPGDTQVLTLDAILLNYAVVANSLVKIKDLQKFHRENDTREYHEEQANIYNLMVNGLLEDADQSLYEYYYDVRNYLNVCKEAKSK